MEDVAKQFVRQRAALWSQGSGWRVPASLRELASRYGRWALDQGESLGSAATRLGVSRATLDRWLAQVPSQEPPLREVVICEAAPEASEPIGGLTLVTPEGFRIEGLAREELVGLLRALR